MTIEAEITQLINSALTELELVPVGELVLEHPAEPKFGDFSSNIAMKLFGSFKKEQGKSFKATTGVEPVSKDIYMRDRSHQLEYNSPHALAQAMADQIGSIISRQPSAIDKVEVAGPGFINFYLGEEWLISQLESWQMGTFNLKSSFAGKRVVVEYTDPNPFKEFHIGHLYSNTVGESIATLIEATGAKVWRADFFGDVGMHVAKSIWGLLKNLAEDGITMADLEVRSLTDRVKYMGKSYARGATAYEEDERAKEEMKLLNFLGFKAAQEVVLPQHDKTPEINYDQFIQASQFSYPEIKEIYALGRKWSLEYFETIYARLGTKFKGYYPESLTGEYGYGMVMDGLSKGIFEKGEQGAIIFPGGKHGLHNRVFINSLGLPTYETKDFGNAVAKYKEYPYDHSIIVTANEINAYFVVVLKALRMLEPELGEKTTHIGHGIVKLPEGKMSSRTGKIVQGEWLIEEAKKRILEILETTRPELSAAEKDRIAELVGIGAIKFAFLKQSIGGDISFSFEESLSFQGNSGPYIQYTYARCRSILEKVKGERGQLAETQSLTTDEKNILRLMYQFPEVVQKAAEEFAPHHLAVYLFEVAQAYNAFYTNCPVLTAENEATKVFRLQLTKATANVLKEGLRLLGIQAPEKM